MAGEWLRMRHDLRETTEVIAIALELKIDPDTVVGKLHRVWTWADKHTSDGSANGVTLGWFDEYLGCKGFAQSLVNVGWLKETAKGVAFPKFDNWNSKSSKVRADATLRKRKQRQRELMSQECHENVTLDMGQSHEQSEKNGLSASASYSFSSSKESKIKTKAKIVPNPKPPFDSLEALNATVKWIDYRSKIKKPVTQMSIDELPDQWMERGVARYIAAVNHTIAQGWQGLREPDQNDARAGPSQGADDLALKEIFKGNANGQRPI